MPEMPDDAVAHVHAERLKERKQLDIQGDDFAVVDIVADLPAQATLWMQHPSALLYDVPLLLQVHIQVYPSLVGLAQVVWR